jgi:hypothetical protein
VGISIPERERPSRTDVVITTTRGEVAATLLNDEGGEPSVQRSPLGLVTLTDRPGDYTVLAHARVADTVGRQSLHIRLRSFDTLPQMSDLVVTPTFRLDSADRSFMLAHLQRDLTFPAGAVVRTYCELYGLRGDNGVARYHAKYLLLRTSDPTRDVQREEWPQAIVLEFDRQLPIRPEGLVVEAVDLNPLELKPGQYVLRLSVRDMAAGLEMGKATIAFQIR